MIFFRGISTYDWYLIRTYLLFERTSWLNLIRISINFISIFFFIKFHEISSLELETEAHYDQREKHQSIEQPNTKPTKINFSWFSQKL